MNIIAYVYKSEIVDVRRKIRRVAYRIMDLYSREVVGMIYCHTRGTDFFVDDFSSHGKGSLGVRAVRQTVRQIKKDFPEMTDLRGPRLTGARMISGTVDGGGHARL
jgi:hypothetical protein